MAFSVLNRKCGCSCILRALNCARTSCALSSDGVQLAFLKSAVIAEARLDPQHAPVGDDVLVKARHHQHRKADQEGVLHHGLQQIQLDEGHRLQREFHCRKCDAEHQVQGHARAPCLPFHGPPPSEPEHHRGERGGNVDAYHPRGQRFLPVRRLVPVEPPGQFAAEIEETEDRPGEEIRQIPVEFLSGGEFHYLPQFEQYIAGLARFTCGIR